MIYLKQEQELDPSNDDSQFIMGRAIDVASRILRELFGSLGFREFTILSIKYISDQNIWRFLLARRIDKLDLRYELLTDSDSGFPTAFRKIS